MGSTGSASAAGEHRRVAGGLDRVNELLGGNGGGVEVDAGPLGGVVDRGAHAVELVEATLDAARARRTGHARDGQLEALGGAGGLDSHCALSSL